jgi:hypothetical protein
MRRIINIISVLVLLSVTFTWSGCKKDNGPEVNEFIIQIDSLVHPDTISFGLDMEIKLYGLIGPNGCYEFDKLVPEYTTGKLSVTSWGKHTIQDLCTEQIVYMNGKILFVSELSLGNSSIIAVQPDGTTITQNVFVRE